MFSDAIVTASMGDHGQISWNYWRILINFADFRMAANILTFILLLFRGVGDLSLQALARKPWLAVYRAHAGFFVAFSDLSSGRVFCPGVVMDHC